MSGPASVIILGEDRAHIRSVYNAVTTHLGIPRRKVRQLAAPAGRGDATNYVLDKLEAEASALRRAPASVRLIVCLDADTRTCNERRREVDRRLTNATLDDARQRESIICIVPKRNIETWLHFGRCETVDETTNYKEGRQSKWSSEDHKIVGALLGMRPVPKENPPPSLSEARNELHAKLRRE